MPLWRFPCVAAGATIIRKSYQTPAASVQQRPAARASQHAPGQIHRTRGAAGKQPSWDKDAQCSNGEWTCLTLLSASDKTPLVFVRVFCVCVCVHEVLLSTSSQQPQPIVVFVKFNTNVCSSHQLHFPVWHWRAAGVAHSFLTTPMMGCGRGVALKGHLWHREGG